MREAAVWTIAVTAGAVSFAHFESVYQSLDERWTTFAVTGNPHPARVPAAPAAGSSPPAAPPQTATPRLTIDAASWTPVVTREPERPRNVLLEANAYGHFHVDATINGRTVELMTDTGATFVALSYETALDLGFTPASLKFSGRSNTANGIARVAPITLEAIRIGDIEIRDVAAVVAEPGKMNQNLLGMSFIAKLSGFELRGRQLVLSQ
jgi:aspartyl protease family protein